MYARYSTPETNTKGDLEIRGGLKVYGILKLFCPRKNVTRRFLFLTSEIIRTTSIPPNSYFSSVSKLKQKFYTDPLLVFYDIKAN